MILITNNNISDIEKKFIYNKNANSLSQPNKFSFNKNAKKFSCIIHYNYCFKNIKLLFQKYKTVVSKI